MSASTAGSRCPATPRSITSSPWSRYPAELGHNFVLAHATCNHAKSDYMAAEEHLAAWSERNESNREELHARLREAELPCDLSASVQVAEWAYEQTEKANGQVWVTERTLRHPRQNGVSCWSSNSGESNANYLQRVQWGTNVRGCFLACVGSTLFSHLRQKWQMSGMRKAVVPMAIDVFKETVVSFADAANRLLKLRAGKAISVTTIYRWAMAGNKVAGWCVSVSETIKVGGNSRTIFGGTTAIL